LSTHGGVEILLRPAPPRGIDPRRAIQRFDLKARIIGERRQARGLGRGARLEDSVLLERNAGFLGLGQVELPRGYGLDIEWRKQLGELLELAGIVTGDHQAVPGLELAH
jgi:hypothetical protein